MNAKISFLIYNNRSGSTYLSALLDNFKEIGVSLESPIFFNLLTGKPIFQTESDINQVFKAIYADRKFKEWGVPQKELENQLISNLPLTNKALIQFILEIYFRRVKPNSKHWVCKIGNPYLLGKILKVFEESKFIFIYRDGRAVFCSQKRTFSRNIGAVMEKDPVRAAMTWSIYIKIIKTLESKLDIIIVKYEDFILDTEKELKKLYRFLTDTEYDKEMLDIQSNSYFQKIPQSQSHLHSNVGSSPLKSRIDAWRNEISYFDGYLFEKKAYLTLKEMGYETIFYGDKAAVQSDRQLFTYRLKLFCGRILHKINRFLFHMGHPAFAWKKLMTIIETRF